jgi:threonine dehydrogenase-like Zn-dependent dehydrogenase
MRIVPARTSECLPVQSDSCVQRDGALTQFIVMPREKLFPARLTREELCFVEPLTIGFHAVTRGRVAADDTVAVFGCGGIGLGAIAGQAVSMIVPLEEFEFSDPVKARSR